MGDYVYYSADKGAQHAPDRLTLRQDGKYTLVHVSGPEPVSQEKGTWRLVGAPVPNVLLNHVGFPVQIKDEHVRLLINVDLGQWYERSG